MTAIICDENIWVTTKLKQMKLNKLNSVQNEIYLPKFEWEIQRYVDFLNDFTSFQYAWHDTSSQLSRLSGIRARWGIKIYDKFEDERPLASVGPPLGGWAATLTPLSPMYSSRPCCLVLAISRYPCLDPDLGPRPAWLIRPTLH